MARATSRRLIASPIDRVFALAARAELFPTWNPLFVEIRNVSGPLDQPAAHFDALMQVAGHRLETHHMVTDVSVPHSLVITALARRGGRLTWTRRFARAGSNATEMDTDLEYVLPRGFASTSVGSPSLEREIENDVIRSAEGFAALAEAAVGAVT